MPADLIAQEQAVAPPPSANDLHEFTRLLADERIQNWIAEQADGADLADDIVTISPREQLQALRKHTRERVAELQSARAAAPEIDKVFWQRWTKEVPPDQQVRGLTFVMIFLFLGAGLEWLFRQYTDPIRLRIELSTFDSLSRRAIGAAFRALIAVAALLVFAAGSIGAFAAFDWPPVLEVLVLSLLVFIFAVRAISAVLVLFLAPRVAELRLVPLSNSFAKTMSTVLLLLSGFLMLAVSVSDVYSRIAAPDQAAASLAVSVLLAAAVLMMAVVCINFTFRRFAKEQHRRLSKSQRMWRLYLTGLSLLVFGAFVLGMQPVMWTLALIGLLIPGVKLLRLWVNHSFDKAISDFYIRTKSNSDPVPVAAQDAGDPAANADTQDIALDIEPQLPVDPYETYRPIAQRLARFVAIFGVGIAVGLIWGLGVFEASASPTLAGKFIAILIDSAVALLIADLVWVWAKTAIDRRLAAYQPPEPGSAPGPEARMATLLPLLRVVLMVTLLAMVALSVLSSTGVNIAPILAGAGVLGIAIGFGAQSLVKDVVSGVFFLIDDAFRVGEYVEIDQLRGTVEKISVRSLQIRHHRGAVHTLPFGELKSLTNHSRDWVIMKLEFRVPFDTDLKLVKKIVKEIGATLKANPDYGDGIIETLKSQGVRRMEEFNMVVGVKFMTRPGEQWLVRRDAYQMVRDAFDKHGIRMAERNVKVEVAGGEHLTDEARTAVSAAAQDAIQQPVPAGPVPDEP
ncbi:MAG: mechanosensitive ion channel family protein [Sulfitobacter sp.]